VRLILLACVAAVLVTGCGGDEPAASGAPETANLWVDGDGGSCVRGERAGYDDAKACESMQAAYAAAQAGDVVVVRPGSYPAQAFGGVRDPVTGNTTPAPHDRRVTFVGDPSRPSRVKLYQLHFGGDDVTVDGFDVDSRGEDPGPAAGAALETDGGSRNTTVRHSRIGNIDCQKAVTAGGDGSDPQPATIGLTFDDVVFHDVTTKENPAGCHNECIKVEAQGITIRNSTFRNCATMSISLGYGDHYGMGPYCCVTLVNNVVAHNTDADDGWHEGANVGWFVGKVDRVRMVNNTFERGIGMDAEHIGPGPYSGVIANNVGGGWACLPGVTYTGNVGTKCSDTDIAVDPYQSSATETAPFGWVDPERFDFHLTADSPAVGAADPEYAPKTDRDGRPRGDDDPDAGAYERH
jgi:hypothetical protein